MNQERLHIHSLNQGITKYGKAPHKPILLLAVLDSFEAGEITDNWIEITDELLQRFHDNWRLLVKTPHSPTFALPFFHLKNEKGKFWQLVTLPGKEIPTTNSNSIKSFRALNETVMAAQLSEEMYAEFSNPVEREVLRKEILEHYFGINSILKTTEQSSYTQQIKEQILYEPEQNYARHVRRQIEEQAREEREEFAILRSSVFRKAILEVYDNQCSISGLKVTDASNRPLVDACHIAPFAESFNDSIRNGIAISPTLHRAFDRGLIAISNQYRVIVHPKLRDFNPDAGIRQYENKEIILPQEQRFHPSIKRFEEHRRRFGFQ